ncbi:MAG: V-type ATP synthase subunit E [Spirochaetaceae bacterium]|jgi:V/A-type H+-transporting ATPase subunit E|nr:V-type ATP synthase subunit E [Spirochaetaceae bacterium]
MDIQLQELIEKIKKEGVESAQADAAKLKAVASSEAKKIVEEAKKQADSIIAGANADRVRSEKAGVAAVEQASRNLVLAFKGEIQGLLDKIVRDAVAASYSVEVVKAVLPDLIKNWAAKNTDSLAVALSESDLKKIDDGFKAKLAARLKGGVDFTVGKTLDAGFHIVEKDGSAFYDFSAEAVAALLSAYLNPKLAESLKNAAKGL